MSQTFAQLINGKSATVEFSTGSASTPSVAFSGDTNTGIYSPGADQVAISTGGSGRLFVDASGNVGVGASSLSRNFTVRNASTIVAASLVSNPANIAYLLFGDTDADAQGRVQYNNSTDSLELYSAGSERLRITSAGLVGVGTSSPDGTTHIHTASAGTVTANSSADDLVVENSGAGGISILTPDGSNGSLFFGTPSDAVGAAARWNYTSGEFFIGSDKAGAVTKLTSGDGTTAVTIDSSQRVGIGTSSPLGQLSVGATPVGFNAGSIASPTRGNIFYDTDGSGWQLRIGKLQSGTFTPQMTFQDDSTIGIGITSPKNALSMGEVGSIDTDANSFYVGNNFTSTGINFRKTGNYAQRLMFDTATGNIMFSNTSSTGTAGNAITWSERMRILSNGATRIGASTAASTEGVDYPLEIISSSSAGVVGGLASYYGLISGAGYAVNHGSDNDNTCGVTFELTTQGIGGWRPGSFFVKVARCKGDATLATSAWYYYNFIMYAGSIGGSAVLQDSGGATGSFTVTVTSTTGSWDNGTKQSVIMKVSVNSGSFSDAYTTMVVDLNTYNQTVRSERTSS